MTETAPQPAISTAQPDDFFQLLKPRVMSLVIFTAVTGLVWHAMRGEQAYRRQGVHDTVLRTRVPAHAPLRVAASRSHRSSRTQVLLDRMGDIEVLATYFGQRMAAVIGWDEWPGFGPRALAAMEGHDWPGNVRELRNLIERSLILGQLNVSALYPPLPSSPVADTPVTDLQTLEKRHIQSVLESVHGDKTKAAQLLGVSRRTLERRVAEWASP